MQTRDSKSLTNGPQPVCQYTSPRGSIWASICQAYGSISYFPVTYLIADETGQDHRSALCREYTCAGDASSFTVICDSFPRYSSRDCKIVDVFIFRQLLRLGLSRPGAWTPWLHDPGIVCRCSRLWADRKH